MVQPQEHIDRTGRIILVPMVNLTLSDIAAKISFCTEQNGLG